METRKSQSKIFQSAFILEKKMFSAVEELFVYVVALDRRASATCSCSSLGVVIISSFLGSALRYVGT